MADIFSKAKRSEVMSRIRSRGNKDTEGAMVLLLRAAGIRGWRRHLEVRIPIYDLRGGGKKADLRIPTPTQGRGVHYDLRGGQKKAGTGVAVRGPGRKGKGKPAKTSNVQLSTSNLERGKAGCTGGPIIGETRAKAKRVSKLRAAHVSLRPFRVRPDFVWRRERVAVFVDGCFWHGCPWHGTMPASNKSFWQEKLTRNRERDRLVSRTLRKAGWRVVRVWEHVLPKAARDAGELAKLIKKIRTVMD